MTEERWGLRWYTGMFLARVIGECDGCGARVLWHEMASGGEMIVQDCAPECAGEGQEREFQG